MRAARLLRGDFRRLRNAARVDDELAGVQRRRGVVRGELEAYGHGLIDKPEIVALTKADALAPEAIKQQVGRLKRAAKATPLVISAVSGAGVPDASRKILAAVDA